jgi:glutamate synthase (NADPH/NADH) small chain
VVVVGGGNTAIDAAVQARRLGAEEVTIVYRRDAGRMSATMKEQAWARANDVRVRDCLVPLRCIDQSGILQAVVFARTDPASGAPLAHEEALTIEADMVLSAIGQLLMEPPLEGALAIANGRIVVDANLRTSVPRIYAGGDCIAGPDLTVNAVQDGQQAAEAIHRALAEQKAA